MMSVINRRGALLRLGASSATIAMAAAGATGLLIFKPTPTIATAAAGARGILNFKETPTDATGAPDAGASRRSCNPYVAHDAPAWDAWRCELRRTTLRMEPMK